MPGKIPALRKAREQALDLSEHATIIRVRPHKAQLLVETGNAVGVGHRIGLDTGQQPEFFLPATRVKDELELQ